MAAARPYEACVAALDRIAAFIRSAGDVGLADKRQLNELESQLYDAVAGLPFSCKSFSSSQQGAVARAVLEALQALAGRPAHVDWVLVLSTVLAPWSEVTRSCMQSSSELVKEQLTACLQQQGEWADSGTPGSPPGPALAARSSLFLEPE
jgi:hypothetical protein